MVIYFALIKLVLPRLAGFSMGLACPNCGSQSSLDLPEESLQEFEVYPVKCEAYFSGVNFS
jgi:hypothetical protein